MFRASRSVDRLILPLLALLLMGVSERAVRLPVPATPPADIFSFSQPEKIVVRHIDLDLTLDIAGQRIAGTATLDLQNFSGTTALVLDTRGLEIGSVTRDGHIRWCGRRQHRARLPDSCATEP